MKDIINVLIGGVIGSLITLIIIHYILIKPLLDITI